MKTLNKKMTLDQALKKTGARSDYHLAQILGLTRQAISLWRQKGRIAYRFVEPILNGEISANHAEGE